MPDDNGNDKNKEYWLSGLSSIGPAAILLAVVSAIALSFDFGRDVNKLLNDTENLKKSVSSLQEKDNVLSTKRVINEKIITDLQEDVSDIKETIRSQGETINSIPQWRETIFMRIDRLNEKLSELKRDKNNTN